jgi:hypothetical protein
MYLKVVIPTIEADLGSERNYGGQITGTYYDGDTQTGDIVQAGFVISNSEVGAGMFSVEQMIFRVRCRNGLIAGERLARRHLGSRIEGTDGSVWSDRTQRLDDRTILSAAQDMVRAAVDETRFQALAAQMQETIDTPPMASPLRGVEVLAKKHNLTDEERDLALTHLIRDEHTNGLGLFGLLNAVTRSAADVEEYERATELEKLGGTLLDMPAQEWEAFVAA